MQWLKHAFAIEPEGPAQPTESQRLSIDQVCRIIRDRELTAPALIFLEMFRPLHFVGSQAAHFFQPFVTGLGGGKRMQDLACFLEQRGSVEYICRRIEALDKEQDGSDGSGSDSMHVAPEK